VGFIIYVVHSTRQAERNRKLKEELARDKEHATQREYNEQQWVDRKAQIVAKNKRNKQPMQVPRVARAQGTGRQSPPVSKPRPQPAASPAPSVPTPAPVPASPDSSVEDMLIGAAVGMVLSNAFHSSAPSVQEEEKPSITSGGGGDFGGDGASGSWDSSESSSLSCVSDSSDYSSSSLNEDLLKSFN
jgi:hypothetical protein